MVSAANLVRNGFAARAALLGSLCAILFLTLCDDPASTDTNSPGSGTWTVSGSTLTDPNGNTYTTVRIGTQTWTVENLKTTKFNDGTAIPQVTEKTAWSTLTTPGYSWYGNDEAANKATYGALYNWYAVNTGKLAPAGWRIPTKADLATLTAYLEGDSLAGGKIKETGTLHWQTPNTAATNSSGFSALPGGMRHEDGTFYYQREFGCWWSATEYTGSFAHGCDLGYNRGSLHRSNYPKGYGHSVRLVSDN
jgi:uncharacterized protein (TIGR02145 family)